MEIDLLVGSNVDEWNFFLVPGGARDHFTPEVLVGVAAAYGLPGETALTTDRAARPGASAFALLAAVQGDWYVRIPVLRLVDADAASSVATYLCEFAWRSPRFDGRLGACHGFEIAFAFDALGKALELLLGGDPP